MTRFAILRDPRTAKLALVVLAIAYVAAHVAALFFDAFHWDELVLFRRAEIAAATGVLDGGGRPGLGVVLLVSAVDGCSNTVGMLHVTRVAWAALTLGLLSGLFVFLAQATRRSADAWLAAALGTACLAFVPLFLRWSLQIRTDQASAACALWAGVALFSSRNRPWVALLAGALFATGYLFTQKAIYLTALVGLVVAGDLYIDRAIAWRREALRVAGLVAGAVVALAAYRLMIPLFFSHPSGVGPSIDGGFDLLDWYRWILRFRLYPAMISSVLPQLGLIALVLIAALRAMRRDTEQRRPLTVALVVLLLGVAVGRFHTGSFPHFWITLGVFPAVAIGLGLPGIRELLPRAYGAVAGLAWACLIMTGAIYRSETLADTQAVQRDSFAFVEAHLPPSLRGFSSDGAFVCRRDPAPLPVYLGHGVTQRLFGTDGERNTAQLIEEFRSRPIAFVLDTHRFSSFPRSWRTFFAEHYVVYAHRVALPGVRLTGAAGSHHAVDVIVAGRYRWFGHGRVVVGGRQLDRDGTIDLDVKVHDIELVDASVEGMFVLDVGAPPVPRSEPFYDEMMNLELAGARKRWW